MSYHGNAADLGKRTDIMKSLHSCGNVARLKKGSSISFDGRTMRVRAVFHVKVILKRQILIKTMYKTRSRFSLFVK